MNQDEIPYSWKTICNYLETYFLRRQQYNYFLILRIYEFFSIQLEDILSIRIKDFQLDVDGITIRVKGISYCDKNYGYYELLK